MVGDVEGFDRDNHEDFEVLFEKVSECERMNNESKDLLSQYFSIHPFSAAISAAHL